MALNIISKYIQDPKNPNASIINPQYNPKAQENDFASQIRSTISGETQKAPVSTIATAPTTPTTPAVSTLKDYYKTTSGTALPGVSDRAKTYESLGLGNASQYQGTYNQNLELLTKLANSKGLSVGGDVKASIGFDTGEKKTEEEPTTRTGLYSSLKNLLGIDKAEEETPSKLEIYNKYMESVEADKTRLKGLDDTLSKLELSLKQSEDDIRNRISASGGVVTESQVQRLVASEKKPLVDYYNELVENRNRLAGNITEAEKTAIQRAEAEYTDEVSAYERLQSQLTELYNAGEADMADKAAAAIAEAEAKKGKYIGMQSDNNGNVTVVTQNPDGSYSTQSIGQIGKVDKTKATTQTDEALLKEAQTLEEAQTKISDINNLIYARNEDGTLNTEKYSKGLQKSAQLGIATFPGKWMQEYQSSNDADIASFIGGVEQLISSGTIKSLIDAKAQGATFGALSDRELGIIAASFSKIGRWKVEAKDGRVIGYNVSAKDMAKELNRIKASWEKVISNLQGSTTTSTGYETVLNINFDDYPDEIPQIGETSQSQSRVTVISPDGAEGTIPASQLNDAIAQGYKLKQ